MTWRSSACCEMARKLLKLPAAGAHAACGSCGLAVPSAAPPATPTVRGGAALASVRGPAGLGGGSRGTVGLSSRGVFSSVTGDAVMRGGAAGCCELRSRRLGDQAVGGGVWQKNPLSEWTPLSGGMVDGRRLSLTMARASMGRKALPSWKLGLAPIGLEGAGM